MILKEPNQLFLKYGKNNLFPGWQLCAPSSAQWASFTASCKLLNIGVYNGNCNSAFTKAVQTHCCNIDLIRRYTIIPGNKSKGHAAF